MDEIVMLRGLLREALPYFDAKTRPDELYARMSEEAFKEPRREIPDMTELPAGCRTRVYVAGPYSNGDMAANVKEAVRVSNELLKLGYAPYCPHITHFWHMMFPHEEQVWLALDNEWITCCDALLRIPGDSNGADKEVALAESLGLPVFYNDDIDVAIEEFMEIVPVVRPEDGIPDPEMVQLEARWREEREHPESLPKGIPEGVSVTASQMAANTLQYNSELPKGIPDEVTVAPMETEEPEPGTPPRPLAYKKSN